MEPIIVVEEDPVEEPRKLRRSELAIVRGIAEGKTTKELAGELHLSTYTIETHRHNILQKLKCRNTPQLITLLFRQKILQ